MLVKVIGFWVGNFTNRGHARLTDVLDTWLNLSALQALGSDFRCLSYGWFLDKRHSVVGLFLCGTLRLIN